MNPRQIRVKTILVVERNDGKIFVSEVFDSVKEELYYRPIGGTVEFGESTSDALKREIFEETGKHIVLDKIIQVSENIFTYNGEKGHEIMFTYKGEFEDNEMNDLEEFWISESNEEKIKCLWIDKSLFKENALRLVPEGLSEVI